MIEKICVLTAPNKRKTNRVSSRFDNKLQRKSNKRRGVERSPIKIVSGQLMKTRRKSWDEKKKGIQRT